MTPQSAIDERDGAVVDAMASWINGRPVPPFIEIVHRFGLSRAGFNLRLDLFHQRDHAIRSFGFAIPSAELLDALAQRAPVLEIGAGTGYMTALMRNRGIDVVGTDLRTFDYGFKHGSLDSKQLILGGPSAVKDHADRTVFCSWPSLGEDWFLHSLKEMIPGQRLIVVRESACADDATWEYLESKFEPDELNIPIPVWPGMHDTAEAWSKK